MKVALIIKIGISIVLLISSYTNAQDSPEEYTFVNIEQNNTQRAVSSIVQDSLGLIWMGTNGVGLKKYNGIDFVSYKQDFNEDNSLSSSLIYVTYVDRSDRLWIGTKAGLNLYDRDYDEFKQVVLYRDSVALENVPIKAIQESSNGTLVIGSHYNGLFEVDPETLRGYSVPIITNTRISDLEINSLIKSSTGKLLMGANQGLFEYDGTKAHPVLSIYESSDTDFSYNIESMLQDDDGSIWIGTFSNGLIKVEVTAFNSYEVHNFRITDQRVLSLAQASDGNILCGTENDGLFVLKKNGTLRKNYRYSKFDANSIKSNSIWSIFVDTQSRIWIGYYNNGVGVYDGLSDKFKDIESLANMSNSLQLPSVTGIVKGKSGRIFIGMDGGGIDLYDPVKKNIVHLKNSKNNILSGLDAGDVVALFMDSKDNLWVGTWNSGIFFLPNNTATFINYTVSNTNCGLRSNRIMSFSEDSRGTIWIGSYVQGLHSYNPINKNFSHHNNAIFEDPSPGQGAMRKVLVDKNDTIWMGTTAGLYKLSSELTKPQKVISLKESMHQDLGNKLVVDVIVSLFEDSKGLMWIGTDGAGLCRYDPNNESFVWYGQKDGLGQETIASILEDDNGNLWMAGNNGLSQFDRTSQTFKNFDMNDGLLSNDFNFNAAYKDEDGVIYFGNYGGINYVNPRNIKLNTNKPQVYFTDFKLFNKSVVPNQELSPLKKVIGQTESLTLKHHQSVFTIEYAGMNLTRPKKNQYAFYLEGFENKWNYVGETRSATYTNLPPGDYTFKVKAANNDGVWNETPQTLELTILRPWWGTNLAIFFYVLAVVLTSYFLTNLIKQRIREKRIVQFERDRRIQEETLNDRKIQFFTNISHEFRTPLTLILNPLEDIMHDSGIVLTKTIQEKLRIIHKNTSRLKRLIDELMDFRKLEINKLSVKISEIEAISFVKEISGHFEEEAILKNIVFEVESDEFPITLWSDPSMLEKIIFNILSNAFKITPDHGAITVGIMRCNQKVIFPLIYTDQPVHALEIYVEDTGSGIKKEEIEKVFERFYQVEKMNSQYYGGTGIGLEVVKNFVDLLKGKVVVESDEAIGTKFRVFLPLGNAHFQANELFLGPEEESKEVSVPEFEEEIIHQILGSNGQKTLLIVEDNTELRDYLKNELNHDYMIIEAVNGAQGLEVATKRIPDMILTDVVMPEMDGFEFCKRIREDLKTSHIPLLMLTAKAMTDDWVKGIDSGADVYLSKPFEMKVLKAQLKQIISSRQILFNKYFKDSNNVKILGNTTNLDKKFINKVLDYISANMSDENLNVEHLAEELHLSRSQLYRKIKALTGYSANEFLRRIRLEKAKQMIEAGNESISEVCFKVGFSSPSYFTKCFKAHFGVLPTELK
ncbi:two-component regulator propeller domain-containing protein [uncultured Kriegella sp.]|uniref:two-component regulator propeller domain-containing protein n=1 Tax=uncultured Kriegella sp. TaxID=1798910 RepID=UPI0030D7C62C|tara:strand:+ start:103276 stop:107409 length:4134 start_codon:yes stop_codon:yes gene_type:complete